MFQGWRVRLRETEEALQQGRLAEAANLLRQDNLDEFRPGRELAARIAEGYARRARAQMESGEFDRAWEELQRAFELTGESEETIAARRELVAHILRLVERELSQGGLVAARRHLEGLAKRDAGGAARWTLEEVTRRVASADNLSRRGRFEEADGQWKHAVELRPDLEWLPQRRERDQHLRHRCRELETRLHNAMSGQRWTEALGLADQLLELAPEHRLAEDARRRAWGQVGAARPNLGGGPLAGAPAKSLSVDPSRFLLWVDAVGGFLVCQGSEVVIGQAGGAGIDIPLLADISRCHAKIRRQQESYVLDPIQPTRVGGREVGGPTLLHDGDEIELGRAVLRFRQPHPLSRSVRLERANGVRLQPSCDAVILMAESCVLGPGAQSHIVCRPWSEDVVLFRQGETLRVRTSQGVEVDGERSDGPVELRRDSQVVGADFSLSLEPLPTNGRGASP